QEELGEELARGEQPHQEPHDAGVLEQQVEVARARADGAEEGRQVAEDVVGRRRAGNLGEQRRRERRERRAPARRGGRVRRAVTQQPEIAVGSAKRRRSSRACVAGASSRPSRSASISGSRSRRRSSAGPWKSAANASCTTAVWRACAAQNRATASAPRNPSRRASAAISPA